ncbi:hypothetical protein KHQ89_00755 [Mycoplasmatota bacterium]|nr:hypothetical protein KHQ89_00755 [Mycoplasmatota bacterium]
MAIKCMNQFNSFSEYLKYSEFIKTLNWEIEKELLKTRVNMYQELDQFINFKNTFNKNNISIFPLKSEEIITWFDTTKLMRRLFLRLYEKGLRTENITIIMEYPVVFGNHMRTDYILVYDRLIIVLEFGMFNQDERRSTERYTKKLQESISYRQILSNVIPKEIKVINYVMIYKPEYHRTYNKRLEDNIKYNKLEISKLENFLHHHLMMEDEHKAIFQLEKIAKFL